MKMYRQTLIPSTLIAMALLGVAGCSTSQESGQHSLAASSPSSSSASSSFLLRTDKITFRIENAQFSDANPAYLTNASLVNYVTGPTAEVARKSRAQQIKLILQDRHLDHEILFPTAKSMLYIEDIDPKCELAKAPYSLSKGDKIEALSTANGLVWGHNIGSDYRLMFICRNQEATAYGVIVESFVSGKLQIATIAANIQP